MGVFKEEAIAFETIEKKQVQIFSDAADYGFPYDFKKPSSEITAVYGAIIMFQGLDKKFREDQKLVRNRQEWETGVSVDVVIFWEKDEGYYKGTKYSISFNRLKDHPSLLVKDANAFLSIHSEPYMEKA